LTVPTQYKPYSDEGKESKGKQTTGYSEGKFVPIHAMKAYRRSRGIDPLVLHVSVLRPVAYPGTYCTGVWVGPTDGIDVLREEEKHSFPSTGSEP
jgi:hypothetical protein